MAICVNPGYDNNDKLSLTVSVLGKYNRIDFERDVFGIDPKELTPCDLPKADEPLGVYVPEEILPGYLDIIRLHIRPDLWERDANDKVVRRKPTVQ